MKIEKMELSEAEQGNTVALEYGRSMIQIQSADHYRQWLSALIGGTHLRIVMVNSDIGIWQ